METASATVETATKALLDLPAELLLQVLASLDELTLLRVSTSCKALHAAALVPELWLPALHAFFDGELPPALALAAEKNNPLRALREQVLQAKRLSEREREHKAFQVPAVPFPNSQEWSRALDARIAEEQMKNGCRHSRPGCPYYGCSGGAYSDKTRCYGQWVKATKSNCVAVRLFGASEGTLTAWAKAPEAEQAAPERRRSFSSAEPPRRAVQLFGGDYGPLAKWRDEKLAELAGASAATGAPALGARLAACAREREAAGLYRSRWSTGADVNPGKGDKQEEGAEAAAVAAARRRLSLPKLLAGLHGGLFVLTECGTSIGTIYALDCGVDGSSIADYGDM